MNRCALPAKWRLSNWLWLITALALAACNLNTTDSNISQGVVGAPQVRIVSPRPNDTFMEGVPVNVQALVSNAGPDISRIEVAVDGTVIANRAEPNTAGALAFSVAQTWTAAGAGAHTITVTAFRNDATSSEPQTVTITVVGQTGLPSQPPTAANAQGSGSGQDNGEGGGTNAQAEETSPPPQAQEPTNSPEPETTATPSTPVATFTTGVNVRRGPGRNFDPPLGGLPANSTADILAISTDRQWYKIRYYNADGWVFASLVSVAGDVASLPVEVGPPTPIPATATPIPPTAVPPTAVPQTNVNFVAGTVRLNPEQPACNETFQIFVDVANFGSSASPTASIDVVDTSNGLTTRTVGAVPIIQPGVTVNVGPIPLTVDTNFEAEHTLALIIDPANQIAETDENDNRREIKYTLRRGGC